MDEIIDKIIAEREEQDRKWGEQNHHPLLWFSIIGEEFGEMCQAFNDYTFSNDYKDLKAMEEEAVQLAACCVAMRESIIRQREDTNHED